MKIMKAIIGLVLICMTIALMSSPVLAHQLHKRGEVTRVIDGDTIVVPEGGYHCPDGGPVILILIRIGTVQLIGIDAPNRGQPGFHASRRFLKQLVLNRTVILDVDERRPRDRFGRVRAIVYVDGLNVNEEMIRRGHAVRVRPRRPRRPVVRS